METLIQSPFELVREGRKLNTKKRVKKDISLVMEKPKIKKEHVNCETFSKTQDEEGSIFGLNSDVGNLQVKVEEMPLSIDRNSTDDEQKTITLLDIAMLNIQKLASVYRGETDTQMPVFEYLT